MKNRTSLKKSYFLSALIKNTFTFIVLLTPFASGAQSIFNNPITGSTPSATNPYTTGQTVASHITASGIGHGSGVASNAGNDRYNLTGWSTSSSLNTSDYFEFTLTPDAGYVIDFVSFEYTGQKSGTGPTSYAFRSSLDSYTANIGSPNTTGSSAISLSASTYQNISSAITFRYYAWNASGSGGTYSINDFTFNGTVCAAEPTASSSQSFCGTATVADLTATGTSIKWYLAASGGSALATNTVLTTRTYYATQTLGGCESKTRKAVAVTVSTLPSISANPSTSQQVISSGNSAIPLTITATGSGISYQWYSNTVATNSGGVNLGNSNGAQTNTYTPPTNITGTTYYYAIVTGTCSPSATSNTSGAIIVPEEYTWNVASGNWGTASSWTPARNSPTALDVLKFDGSVQLSPIVNINTTDTIGEFRISNAATVTFSGSSSGTLTTDMLIVNAGNTLALGTNNINITGTFKGAGTISASTGNVYLNGSATQSITGSPTVSNITLNNLAGATISTGTLSITGVYTHTNGTLTTNDSLILIATDSITYGQIAGTGGGDISGAVTAQYIIPKSSGGKWRSISSPFTGNTISDLEDDIRINYGSPNYTYSNVWLLNEVEGGSSARGAWQNVTSGSKSMDSVGFSIYLWSENLSTNAILDLTGTYTKGNFTTASLSRTGAVSDTSGWHLLRNPWPSNYNHTGTINNLQSNTMYVYEGNSVRDWNGVTGSLSNGVIPPFHAITMQINTDGNSITLPAANRITSNSNNYLDKTSLPNFTTLRVINPNSEWDEARVYTNDDAENGLDFWDAAKVMNGIYAPTMFTIVDGQRTSINNLKNIPANGISIPVGFRTVVKGNHTIHFTLENIENDVTVYLEDLQNGTMHNTANGNYIFNNQDSSINPTTRFALHYTRKTGTNTAVNKLENQNVFIGSNGNTVFATALQQDNYTIEVFDLVGRTVAQTTTENTAQNTQYLSVNGVATGYYIVKVSGQNTNKTAKVFLK